MSAGDAADIAGAVADYLKTTRVNAITAGRIFRPKLDPDIAVSEPLDSVVVRRAGGYAMLGGGHVPVGDPRIDVFCYGETDLNADQLGAEVIVALRSLRTGIHRNVRLMSARIESAPVPIVDPDTNWPCAVLSAQIVCYEQTVT